MGEHYNEQEEDSYLSLIQSAFQNAKSRQKEKRPRKREKEKEASQDRLDFRSTASQVVMQKDVQAYHRPQGLTNGQIVLCDMR